MITRAAIVFYGDLYVGKEKDRHHNIIQQIIWSAGVKKVGAQHPQGFINDKGVFLTREEAAQEALQCGQVKVGHANIRHVFDGIRLYSEDLW